MLEPPGGPNPPRGSTQRTAMLALTAAFIFQPLLRPAGPGNSSPVDLFTLAAIVTGVIWAASGHQKLRAPYLIPVGLFVAAGAASGLDGLLPGTALLALADDLLLFAWCSTCQRAQLAPGDALGAGRLELVRDLLGRGGRRRLAGAHHAAGRAAAADGNRVLFTFGDPNYASTYWDTTIFVVYAARPRAGAGCGCSATCCWSGRWC